MARDNSQEVLEVLEVLVERPDAAIGVVRINRAKQRNALNTATRRKLAAAFVELGEEEAIRAIVLTGSDEVFAAGADISEFRDATPTQMLKRRSERWWQAVADVRQPVIAAVNGFALGGGLELAMLADIIIAGEGAKLGQPEVRVGIMPGAGGTQRLTRAVGKFHAMKMVLTGRPIDAGEAFTIGLVSQVVPDADVFDTAMKVARTIAKLPPLAVQEAKQAILLGQDASLQAGLMMERRALQVLFDSRDKSEGMTAFLEKRDAKFTGE